MAPAKLEVIPSRPLPNGKQSGTVIVQIPGHVLPSFMFQGMWPELTRRGRILTVDHPRRGPFSFVEEAYQIVERLETMGGIERLVLQGVSLGGVVATKMVPMLGGDLREAIRCGGIINECGPTDRSDIKGALNLRRLWVWPRFVNPTMMKAFNTFNAGFYVEPAADMNLVRRYWHYQNFFPNSGRRGQLEALAGLNSLLPGGCHGIPVIYIRSGIDPLVEPEAAEKFVAAFSSGPDCIIDTKEGWHAAHPEQPGLWNGLAGEALHRLGVHRFTE